MPNGTNSSRFYWSPCIFFFFCFLCFFLLLSLSLLWIVVVEAVVSCKSSQESHKSLHLSLALNNCRTLFLSLCFSFSMPSPSYSMYLLLVSLPVHSLSFSATLNVWQITPRICQIQIDEVRSKISKQRQLALSRVARADKFLLGGGDKIRKPKTITRNYFQTRLQSLLKFRNLNWKRENEVGKRLSFSLFFFCLPYSFKFLYYTNYIYS